MQNKSLFERPLWVALFAMTAAIVWGWAYPLIKMGFTEFEITQEMTASKMLFAGLRFFLSGSIILGFARAMHKPFALKTNEKEGVSLWASLLFVLVFALLNTTFHYACFYIGLSHSDGARAAILNSLGVFVVVILACIFFQSDRMNRRKVLGCTLGIAGALSLNLGAASSGHFTFLGDGMIILNALCSAAASLLTRQLGKRVDMFVGTGYSLALGGALLAVPAALMGGTFPHITLWGIVILLLLTGISALGFTLYNRLLTCNPVGKIAIYNTLIPVVGALTSVLCLGEPFYAKYILAGGLACAGIYIINSSK